MCGVNLHSFCIAKAHREIAEVDSNAKENSNICSVTCYPFSMIYGLTSEAVKSERALLAQKNKEQLKKEARERQIKVNCRVNGTSRDASKELITAHLLEKKMIYVIVHSQVNNLQLVLSWILVKWTHVNILANG
jgi:hypothetical protein